MSQTEVEFGSESLTMNRYQTTNASINLFYTLEFFSSHCRYLGTLRSVSPSASGGVGRCMVPGNQSRNPGIQFHIQDQDGP